MAVGGRWYRLVEEYCDIGAHRTGTPGDAATAAWFADHLAALGGVVTRHPFEFDRYDAACSVTIDGSPVDAEALPYEAVGSVSSDRPHVAAARVASGDRTSDSLAEVIAAARAAGSTVTVVATEHAAGELEMPNRAPALGSGLPVVLVAGRCSDAISGGDVAVRLRAEIVPATSTNVTARIGGRVAGAGRGRRDRRPIVLAAPLSGWFACAAERGTGIAALLGVVERMASRHPLLVVGASGHELLPHIGLEALLASLHVEPRLVVHFGANVAVGERDARTGVVTLAPGMSVHQPAAPSARGVFVRMPEAAVASVSDALGRAGLQPVVDPPRFLGEGALWSAAVDAPLMSFVGRSSKFHTPGDTIGETVDAGGLELVTSCIGDAVEAFLSATDLEV